MLRQILTRTCDGLASSYCLLMLTVIVICGLSFTGEQTFSDTIEGEEMACNQKVNWEAMIGPDFLEEIDGLITEDLRWDAPEWDVPPEYLDGQTGMVTFSSWYGDVQIQVMPRGKESDIYAFIKNTIREGAQTYRRHFYLTLVWLCEGEGGSEFPKFGAAISRQALWAPEDSIIVQHVAVHVDNTHEAMPIE